MKVWILTSDYNMYDQYGSYFIEVFKNKPSAKQLMAAGVSESQVNHVLSGGGREYHEDMWYNLEEETAK